MNRFLVVAVTCSVIGCGQPKPEASKSAFKTETVDEQTTFADVQNEFESEDAVARVDAIKKSVQFSGEQLADVMSLMSKALKDKDWTVADAVCTAVLEIGTPALEKLPGSHKRYFETRKCMRCHGRGKENGP